MVRHIVMWKFRPGTEAERDLWLTTTKAPRSYQEARFTADSWLFFGKETAGLPLALRERYRDRRVLRGMEGSDYDAVLISEFENQEALERYKNDPRHKAVSALCKSIRTDRAAVDCLLPD